MKTIYLVCENDGPAFACNGVHELHLTRETVDAWYGTGKYCKSEMMYPKFAWKLKEVK